MVLDNTESVTIQNAMPESLNAVCNIDSDAPINAPTVGATRSPTSRPTINPTTSSTTTITTNTSPTTTTSDSPTERPLVLQLHQDNGLLYQSR